MEAFTNAADSYTPNRGGLPAEQDPPWFDVGDLACRYKTSVRHIYRLADGGRMPWGVKLGHLRRWSHREVEVWEAGGCAPMEPPRSAAERANLGKGGHHV